VGRVRRDLAWLAYIPVPGLGLAASWAAPQDRLVRFHARQGGALIIILYAIMACLGLVTLILPPAGRPPIAAIAAAVLALAGVAIVVGVWTSLAGRFTRLRPLWDMVAR
jgi:hypothetical protein